MTPQLDVSKLLGQEYRWEHPVYLYVVVLQQTHPIGSHTKHMANLPVPMRVRDFDI